jgi:hydroxymethylpyrimidine/phosphomethylpyrimidine kinase
MTGPAKPCVCTIAGSDSGGGAGIQADLGTFSALGAWGTSVVTAVTAQNPGGVLGTWMLPDEAVAAQLAAVRSAFPVKAVKTGMLGTAGIVRAVAGGLPEGVPLVVDPVMVATSGGRLLDSEALGPLVELILPRAAVVTPNIAEAAALAGTGPITGLGDMREAARWILGLGPSAVVVKGGDLPSGPATDLYLDRSGELVLEGARYPYTVHGSGCVFSAALAVFLARGMTPREAAMGAKGFIAGALGRPYRDLRGRASADPGGYHDK